MRSKSRIVSEIFNEIVKCPTKSIPFRLKLDDLSDDSVLVVKFSDDRDINRLVETRLYTIVSGRHSALSGKSTQLVQYLAFALKNKLRCGVFLYTREFCVSKLPRMTLCSWKIISHTQSIGRESIVLVSSHQL